MYARSQESLDEIAKHKAGSDEWAEARLWRITASLARRSTSTTSKLYKYAIFKPCDHIGQKVERAIVNALYRYIGRARMIIRHDSQWIAATPDGFHRCMKIPVEIKYSARPIEIKKVIAKNYHQLQIQMYCTDKPQALLILYDGQLTHAIVERDQNFINKCLYYSRISLEKSMLMARHGCGNNCYLLKKHMPIPFDSASDKKKAIILNSKRKNKYTIIHLEKVYPQLRKKVLNKLYAKLLETVQRDLANVKEKKARLAATEKEQNKADQ